MDASGLQKICLLTALACLLAVPAAAASGNADDGSQGQTASPAPCDIILLELQFPFAEVHLECIGSPARAP